MSGVALDYAAVRAGLESVLVDAGLTFTRDTEVSSGTEECRVGLVYRVPERGPVDKIRVTRGEFRVDVRRDRWVDPATLEAAAFSVLKLFLPLDQTLEGGTVVRSVSVGSIAVESPAWVRCRVSVGWEVHAVDNVVVTPTVYPLRDFPNPSGFDPASARSDLEALLPGPFPVSSAHTPEQPAGPHIRTFLSWDPTQRISRAIERQSGVFFILIHIPANDGVLQGEQIAGTIRQEYLPLDQTLPLGTVVREVYLGEPYSGDGADGAGGPAWAVHPVFVEWRHDILRESSNG